MKVLELVGLRFDIDVAPAAVTRAVSVLNLEASFVNN